MSRKWMIQSVTFPYFSHKPETIKRVEVVFKNCFFKDLPNDTSLNLFMFLFEISDLI